MTIFLNIPAAESLKEKRRIIKSLIKRIQNKHNVSVAEVGDNEKWQRCQIGVSVVSNKSAHANSCLSKIVNMVENEASVLLIDYEIELL